MRKSIKRHSWLFLAGVLLAALMYDVERRRSRRDRALPKAA
jgi:hypothetical protein